MNTIQQGLLEHLRMNPTGGIPEAFTSGAAWMAVQFASGVGLKIEHYPRKYRINYYVGWTGDWSDPTKAKTIELWAYDDKEAERRLKEQTLWGLRRSGGDESSPVWIESILPAEIPGEK